MALWTPKIWTGLAALNGLCAVAMGAFATHGMTSPKLAGWLHTGSTYQMYHAIAVIAALGLSRSGLRRMGLVAALFLAGTLFFSGSLYAMAFGGPRILGAVAPVGGAAFMLGWLVMAWQAFTSRPAAVGARPEPSDRQEQR
jgi:uncharacterized membrane protein YgdD (TMEM256/DUF423 family)